MSVVLLAMGLELLAPGPRVEWRVPVSPGYGGASVDEGEVFLLDREEERDVLRVFELSSGFAVWSAGYDEPNRLALPGSRTAPTVHGERVYTAGGHGRVTCFSRLRREATWSVDLEREYGGVLPYYGWSAAPLVVGELLIVAPLGERVGLLALDRYTGAMIWTTEGLGRSLSTPVLVELLGVPQIVFLSTTSSIEGQDRAAPTVVSSFDPEDGALLWRTETLLSRLPIPPPLQVDGERLFLTGGYHSGSKMMRLRREPGGLELEELFHIPRGAQIHAPVLHRGNLFLVANEGRNLVRSLRKEGGLMSLGLDGKEHWRTGEAPFFGYGDIALAGERLLIEDTQTGLLQLAVATPTGFRPLTQVEVFEPDARTRRRVGAPLAVSGDRVLLRGRDELVCVSLGVAPQAP